MSADYPDYSTVILDGVAFKPAEGSKVRPTATDRFPQKLTIGTDYSLDSNDLLSTWIISDLSGGHGIKDLREGVEDNRSWFGNLYTRHPGAFLKPYKTATNLLDALTGTTYPLGDMPSGGTMYRYYANGVRLYQMDTPTGTVSNRGNMTGAPTNKAVGFAGTNTDAVLYVPEGSNGYSAFNPTTVTLRNVSAAELMVDFEVWGDKLIGISTTGQLYYATAGTAAADTTFTSYGAGGKLDPSHTPKRLHLYWNQAREQVIHIVTDRGVFVFDAATPSLYQIPDFWLPHPYFGRASEVWRGNLYVAAGLSVLEFNGNVIRPMGLDRDDGLPNDVGGTGSFINDLFTGNNALYALVRGTAAADPLLLSTVHEWSGFGWHTTFYSGSAMIGRPTWGHVSSSGGIYQLTWGHDNVFSGGQVAYMDLPRGPFNPKQVASTLEYTAGTFYLDTPYFDAGMPGYTKIANAVEVTFAQFPSDHTFTIQYKIDDDTSYSTLGTYSTTFTGSERTASFLFGNEDAYNVNPGEPFKKIQFRVTLADSAGTPTTTPVIKSMVFSFLKVMNPSWSWVLDLDLSSTIGLYSPEQQFSKLVELKNDNRFFAMRHRDTTYRVRIAGFGAAEETALDTRSRVQLNMIEIPTGLGAPLTVWRHSGTFKSNSATSLVSVGAVTGVQIFDLMYASVYSNAGVPTPSDSSWILLNQGVISGGGRVYTFYKVATTSASATHHFTATGATVMAAIISVFTGNTRAVPIDAYSYTSLSAGTSITAVGLTTTRVDDLLIYTAGGDQGTNPTMTPPAGMTEPTNGEVALSTCVLEHAYLLATGAAGSTGNKSGTASATITSIAALAAFKGN